MSQYRCKPAAGPVDATVKLPGSKSITNRALITAALADDRSILTNLLLAEDTRLMIDALKVLGIAITIDERDCVAEVTGCAGHIPESGAELFCGNSGTTIRFCTALVALGHGRFELDGVPRMRQRPIGGLASVLSVLGAGVEYLADEGYPPLAVRGSGLRGGQVVFDAPESSQFVSALLLVAPYARDDVMIEVTGDTPSIPYLKITTAVMDQFGVVVLDRYDRNGARFVVESTQRYRGTTFAVEPDASNATYFLAAPAVAGGRVTVEGLGTESIQGDVAFVDVLEQMGCRIQREPNRLTVMSPAVGHLRGVDVDLNDMPDAVQTLATVALFAEGSTTIRNVGSLRVKETDRLAALRNELTKLGASVEEFSDGLRITPGEKPPAATIDTYDDHRMAMSFALAGLVCPGIVIDNPECAGKTFPDFFDRFEAMASTGR